ncbi:MAG: hypothetical protein H6736_12030 [Alphaproteobacteria bacterium]|nr:hypothetical protein [Alphaproteobacteria bacterium]MCB9692533.1 hypothetical protein [Alphaproteobacteria bacterium]
MLAWEGARIDVLLVDGLDRTSNVPSFRERVADVLSYLSCMRQGVVMVGPPALQVDAPSLEEDWFDQTLVCGAVDTTDAVGRIFLRSVLDHRSEGFFTQGALDHIVTRSGGLMRDLILMARQAVEEAYVDGAERAELAHAEIAAARLGASLLRAVDASTLRLLGDAAASDSTRAPLPLVDPALLASLVLRRLLIPTRDIPMRFHVHPCVLPFLPARSA